MVAAFASASAPAALLVAVVISGVTILGAAIPLPRYLRVAAPPLLFLAASSASLAVSLDFGTATHGIQLHPATAEFPRIAVVCSRSLACLTALLFLTLTTPLSDSISLLRSCKIPETLLDLMTLCYRTLFVLSEAVHDTLAAQSARLGYVTARHSIRSLGGLTANLTLQVWQRSQALHLAAEARCNDGALRFLVHSYPDSRRHVCIAATGGSMVIALAVMFR